MSSFRERARWRDSHQCPCVESLSHAVHSPESSTLLHLALALRATLALPCRLLGALPYQTHTQLWDLLVEASLGPHCRLFEKLSRNSGQAWGCQTHRERLSYMALGQRTSSLMADRCHPCCAKPSFHRVKSQSTLA